MLRESDCPEDSSHKCALARFYKRRKKPLNTSVKRVIAGLVGLPVLLVTLFESFLQSFGFYAEHIIIPVWTYGVRTPLRWQDVVWLCMFWPVALALLCISYRLLKYAFCQN